MMFLFYMACSFAVLVGFFAFIGFTCWIMEGGRQNLFKYIYDGLYSVQESLSWFGWLVVLVTVMLLALIPVGIQARSEHERMCKAQGGEHRSVFSENRKSRTHYACVNVPVYNAGRNMIEESKIKVAK